MLFSFTIQVQAEVHNDKGCIKMEVDSNNPYELEVIKGKISVS